MVINNFTRSLLLMVIVLNSHSVYSGPGDFFSGISSKIQNTLSENYIKPYIIPLEQGQLIKEENFTRLDVGLSRDQVKYLLGQPTSSPFNNNEWNYYYFNNLESKETKHLRIVFKNERVFEIIIDQKLYKKFGEKESYEVNLSSVPIEINKEDEVQNKVGVIFISLADSPKNVDELGQCKSNEYKTFSDVKTLTIADESTLEIRADNQSQTGNEFIAEGNAEAERQNDMLKASKIIYYPDTKNVTASGNVKYFNNEISVYSETAGYQGVDGDITFSRAKYFRSDDIGAGISDEIVFKKNKDVHLKSATYTACSIDDPDWEITSTSTKLFKQSERGHSYNMILKYKDIPIFYSPFMSYPLTDKRQSGILTPSYGSEGDSGTSFSVPYYINLAENYDATIEVTSLSDRGILFDNEFRYLDKNETTLINFTHLDGDDEFGEDRYLYKLDDRRILFNSLTNDLQSGLVGSRIDTEINYSRVSDRDYFDDFGNSLSTVSQSHVNREIRLRGDKYTDDDIISYEISTMSYQPSKRGINQQYQTIPSFNLTYTNKNFSDLNYYIKTRVDKFKHKDSSKVEGTRYVIYPSIEMPMVSDSWELTPKLGVRYIDYSLDNNQNSVSKTTPIASLRGKLYFEKYIGDKYYTLEPEAYLLYVPVGNQDENPIFDTGLKALKYSLFSENKFYGEDRINDAKQMTLALTHRIIDENSGNELFTGTIGQIIYFEDRDVHLTSNTKSHSDASNIIGMMTAQLDNSSSISVGTVFNPHSGYGMRNNVRDRYNASSGYRNKILNMDYRFFRGREEEIDLSGVYSFNKDLSLVGKYNYSFANSRSNDEDLIDTMIGVEYESCCYALKIVAREYWTGVKKDNAFFVEFLPKGITTTNNKTSDLLRRGIPGYIDRTTYD